jgi:hypothetical protein
LPRAWGAVREGYSADGDAWRYFPLDDARSRPSWSDREQRLCFALMFWNGCDPTLKERIFSVSGPEGNHGEDAKECWWYLDATSTASCCAGAITIRKSNLVRLREENARRT